LHLQLFGTKPVPYIADYIFSRYFKYLDQGNSEIKALSLAFYDLKKL